MSNKYFQFDSSFVHRTRANGSEVDSAFQSVEAGFDSLETEINELRSGEAAVQAQRYSVNANFLRNGRFDINQRGLTFNNIQDGSFASDGWLFQKDTDDTVNLSALAFTPGQSAVPGNPRYYCRIDSTAGSTGTYMRLIQRLEDVFRLQNREVRLKLWANPSENISLVLTVKQNYGTGGSAETQSYVGTLTAALVPGWQEVALTFLVPGISGKTVGADSYLEVGFQLPTLNTYTLDLAQGSLCPSELELDWIDEDIALALTKARRYYRRYATQRQLDDLQYEMRVRPSEVQGAGFYEYSAEL